MFNVRDIGPYRLEPANGGASQGIPGPFTPMVSTQLVNSDSIFNTASRSDLTLEAQDFTWETWIYHVSTDARIQILYTSGASNFDSLQLRATGTVGKYQVYSYNYFVNNSSQMLMTSLSDIKYGEWTHIAITREGSAFAMFINGVREDVANTEMSMTVSNTVSYHGNLNAYYHDLRVVIGSHVYSAYATSINVPTAPLTAIPNTLILTFQKRDFRNYAPDTFTGLSIAGEFEQAGFTPYLLPNNYEVTREGWSTFFEPLATVSVTDTSAFSFGTADFSLEFWIFLELQSFTLRLQDTTTEDNILILEDPALTLGERLRFDAWGNNQINGEGLTKNQWYHIALTKQGTTLRFFRDGVLLGSWVDATAYDFDELSFVKDAAAEQFRGYVSNLRTVKGTAVYTDTFTVTDQPLTLVTGTSLLTLNESFIFDASANELEIVKTGHVGPVRKSAFDITDTLYFPDVVGSSAEFRRGPVVIPADDVLTLSNQAFIIEFWVYRNFKTGQQYLFDYRVGATTDNFYNMYFSSTTLLLQQGTNSVISANLNTYGRWTHIAVSRQKAGTDTIRVFVNGNALGTTGSLNTNTGFVARPLTIGSTYANASRLSNGYLSDFRIRIGDSYVTNFTPPTEPMTPTAYTRLLLDFKNPEISDASAKHMIGYSGNVGLSSDSIRGSKSIYFPGAAADYIEVPISPMLSLGQGDFTIEAWIKPEDNLAESGLSSIVNQYITVGTTTVTLAASTFNLYRHNTNGLLYFAFRPHSTGALFNSTNPIAVDVWTHIAVVRHGDDFTMYINGAVEATAVSTAKDGVKTADIQIGRITDNAGYRYKGWIDDLRIMRTAVYTEAFTPPDEHAPSIAYDV